MTTRRDLIVIGSTILGIHLIKWIQKYKQQRLTKPVEISKEDLEPDHWYVEDFSLLELEFLFLLAMILFRGDYEKQKLCYEIERVVLFLF